MTATSAASTLGESWNRRHPVSKESFAPQPMAPQPMPEGLRFSPPSLATLDRPQGRVLVVVDDALVALDLQRLLHEAGYRVVGPATTVAEIQRMIRRGDIDCAILDLDIDRRAPLPIADLLAFAEVPFVYLTTGVLVKRHPRPGGRSRRPEAGGLPAALAPSLGPSWRPHPSRSGRRLNPHCR